MKHAKKLASLLLVLVMVFALTATAFADATEGDENSNDSNTPTITIDNAVVGQTYTIYRILALESYHVDDATTGAGQYAYKATTAWENFINGTGIKEVYVDVDTQGYVTWHENADAAAFAKLAQAYAKDNKIDNQGTTIATASEGSTDTVVSVTFNNLDLGYYLLDSSLGTLCALDTTNPNVIIKEKNEVPTNTKNVQEDKDSSWGTANDADIGQIVTFKSTITIPKGAQNLVFYDKMESGLTLDTNNIKVFTDADMTEELANNSEANYSVTTGLTDCTFKISFTESYLNSLPTDSTSTNTTTNLYVIYTATLNENAVVGGNGNKNESWLTYGEDRTDDEGNTVTSSTTHSETLTYTWEVSVFKYTSGKDSNGNETKNGLSGVTFKLSTDETGNDVIKLVPVTTNSENESEDESNDGDDDNVPVYRVAIGTVGEDGTVSYETNATDTITTDSTGKFEIVGLDADTYYLTETATPAGYNKLAGPIKIVISTSVGTTTNGLTSTVSYYDYNTTAADDGSHYGSRATGTGEVQVLNQSGTELPSTGGMGTTLFYVIGGILVVAAVVLLITKKRMSAEK